MITDIGARDSESDCGLGVRGGGRDLRRVEPEPEGHGRRPPRGGHWQPETVARPGAQLELERRRAEAQAESQASSWTEVVPVAGCDPGWDSEVMEAGGGPGVATGSALQSAHFAPPPPKSEARKHRFSKQSAPGPRGFAACQWFQCFQAWSGKTRRLSLLGYY